MSRKIVCEICDQEVESLSGTQRTCLAKTCKAKLRSNTRKLRYYEQRKDPVCEWCDEPILEARKRHLHEDCGADKNRMRVRAYNEAHKTRVGPKKPRRFSGSISCMICCTVVPRTGTRQVICKARECDAALSNKNKREARVRHREITQLRVLKQERQMQKKPPRQPEVGVVFSHRIVI